MTRKRKSPVAKTLVKNGCAAMLAAIEIHNKPVFDYRYEVSTLLVISAWESVFKSIIYKNWKQELFEEDGHAKQLRKCLACLATHWGKEFLPVKESVENLYIYRNKVAHFHSEDLDGLLFSILRTNVSLFVTFIKEKCEVDLCKATFVVLPISLSPEFNPVEFLVKQPKDSHASLEVRDFVNGLVESCRRLEDAGFEDSIFSTWDVHLASVKQAKNADIIAARSNTQSDATPVAIINKLAEVRISDSPHALEVRLSEEEFSDLYPESYSDVLATARSTFSDFKADQAFHDLMSVIKSKHALCGKRPYNPQKPDGAGKSLFSKRIYEELAKHYKCR